MNAILLCTAAGFVIGAVFFAYVFSQRVWWGPGMFLAFLANIPNLIFLSYLVSPKYGSDPFTFIVIGLAEVFGVGGFGLGAIVGMIFGFVRANRARGS